ncbi:hypothetical protein D3C79_625120 [compost metagenome]
MGIHVGVKTIFVGSRQIPGGWRLFAGQGDLHDRLDAFEAVLPWSDQAQRSTVLRWQHLAIHAHGQQSQWMHGFIKAQTFDIGILEATANKAIFLAGHLFWIV